MSPEFGYENRSVNDKSQLTAGWHPAMLLGITDEETPPGWKMAAASPRMWRWHFAVWAMPNDVPQGMPERQSAPSSQKFSPKRVQAASKAYLWTSELLGRQIQPGEKVSLDALYPLPCRVKISRTNTYGVMIDYANIIDLEKWPEGQPIVTADFKAKLLEWFAHPDASPASVQPSTTPPWPVPDMTQAPATPGGNPTW